MNHELPAQKFRRAWHRRAWTPMLQGPPPKLIAPQSSSRSTTLEWLVSQMISNPSKYGRRIVELGGFDFVTILSHLYLYSSYCYLWNYCTHYICCNETSLLDNDKRIYQTSWPLKKYKEPIRIPITCETSRHTRQRNTPRQSCNHHAQTRAKVPGR